MRYAALNQGAGDLAHYGDFSPAALFNGNQDPAKEKQERYSDEQLYALGLYIYSLQRPSNPNRFDAVAQRGQNNNKLVPAPGFVVPKEHAAEWQDRGRNLAAFARKRFLDGHPSRAVRFVLAGRVPRKRPAA